MPYKNPEKARAYERERHRRRTAERLAQGKCARSAGRPRPAPGRKVCESCREKGRAAERARYAKGKAEGRPYGGRNPEHRRRMARERNRRRRRERRDAGLCAHPAGSVPRSRDGAVCETCREARRAAERELYATRRAAGLCGRCGGPASAASRCGPYAALDEGRDREKRNAARRERYADKRVRCLCTDCGAPSEGAARCEACARRSYHSSDEHRGLPLYPPRYTVVELATGEEHGPWDSWEEVAMCLAFARLSRDEVEIIEDACVMATLTAWG